MIGQTILMKNLLMDMAALLRRNKMLKISDLCLSRPQRNFLLLTNGGNIGFKLMNNRRFVNIY